jgi:hypothetical protein
MREQGKNEDYNRYYSEVKDFRLPRLNHSRLIAPSVNKNDKSFFQTPLFVRKYSTKVKTGSASNTEIRIPSLVIGRDVAYNIDFRLKCMHGSNIRVRIHEGGVSIYDDCYSVSSKSESEVVDVPFTSLERFRYVVSGIEIGISAKRIWHKTYVAAQ